MSVAVSISAVGEEFAAQIVVRFGRVLLSRWRRLRRLRTLLLRRGGRREFVVGHASRTRRERASKTALDDSQLKKTARKVDRRRQSANESRVRARARRRPSDCARAFRIIVERRRSLRLVHSKQPTRGAQIVGTPNNKNCAFRWRRRRRATRLVAATKSARAHACDKSSMSVAARPHARARAAGRHFEAAPMERKLASSYARCPISSSSSPTAATAASTRRQLPASGREAGDTRAAQFRRSKLRARARSRSRFIKPPAIRRDAPSSASTRPAGAKFAYVKWAKRQRKKKI